MEPCSRVEGGLQAGFNIHDKEICNLLFLRWRGRLAQATLEGANLAIPEGR